MEGATPTGGRPGDDRRVDCADPVPELRVVHHVHRVPGGAISAVCAGAAAAAWSPRPVAGVLEDLCRGTARYVVSWFGDARPVVALPRPEGGRYLHSTNPAGHGNALDSLPSCPVHASGAGGPGQPEPGAAELAACRARHPSSWPPRLLPPV
ncbi:hypothetical protein GCM10023162_22240 [Klenkia terrae]